MTVKSAPTIADQAGAYFGHGFHCAEAVARSVLDGLGQDGATAAAHATGFGGGMGRTHAEACGALSGALIVIGHLYGRREPGPDWDRPADLSADFRKDFISAFGTTRCQTLCDRFGSRDQMDRCRDLVRWTAQTLCDRLLESGARD